MGSLLCGSDPFFYCGSDEVGRGPLAGPVVACSLYLESTPPHVVKVRDLLQQLSHLGVSDSKKLKPKVRQKICQNFNIDVSKIELGKKIAIKSDQHFQLSFSVVAISPRLIDEINILNASLKAMLESFKKVKGSASQGIWWVDGNRTPVCNFSPQALVKGDQKSLIIGLASIIAKEYRDNLMREYSRQYPQYGFEMHAGYPTKKHKLAIKDFGVSTIHRKTFRGVKEFI